MCVCFELEDVTTAIDLQDVYSKVKSKAGSINIFHKEKRYSGNSFPVHLYKAALQVTDFAVPINK